MGFNHPITPPVVKGGKMIEWYSNKKVKIYFDCYPYIATRYFVPSMSEIERKSVEKYPFINKKDLSVCLVDRKKAKEYRFKINKGYCFDGASIPRLFWRVIGSNTDNMYLIPAMIHDVLCENHQYVDNDRRFSTEVFNALLEANKVCVFKRFWMKHSVNLFQAGFCHWKGGKCGG